MYREGDGEQFEMAYDKQELLSHTPFYTLLKMECYNCSSFVTNSEPVPIYTQNKTLLLRNKKPRQLGTICTAREQDPLISSGYVSK